MFGKKLSLDEILRGIDNLSDDEKEKVADKMADLYKAEDEREIDKIEEEKANDGEKADEKAEEKAEESEEIGKDVDEVEEDVKEDEDDGEDVDYHDYGDDIKDIFDRLDKIEKRLNGYDRAPKKADEEKSKKLSYLDRKFN